MLKQVQGRQRRLIQKKGKKEKISVLVDTYLQFLVGPRVSPEFLVINVVFCVVISLCLSED